MLGSVGYGLCDEHDKSIGFFLGEYWLGYACHEDTSWVTNRYEYESSLSKLCPASKAAE